MQQRSFAFTSGITNADAMTLAAQFRALPGMAAMLTHKTEIKSEKTRRILPKSQHKTPETVESYSDDGHANPDEIIASSYVEHLNPESVSFDIKSNMQNSSIDAGAFFASFVPTAETVRGEQSASTTILPESGIETESAFGKVGQTNSRLASKQNGSLAKEYKRRQPPLEPTDEAKPAETAPEQVPDPRGSEGSAPKDEAPEPQPDG